MPHIPVPHTHTCDNPTPVPHTHLCLTHTPEPHTPVSPICREPASHLTEVMSGGELRGRWTCHIPRPVAAGGFSGRSGGGGRGVGHSLPQSYHLPSEPRRPPHATPVGGRGPPRLAKSWAKRRKGSLFGLGAAQGPAWNTCPQAQRPSQRHHQRYKGTSGNWPSPEARVLCPHPREK